MNEPIEKKVAALLRMQSALAFSRGSAGLYALLVAIAKRYGPGDVIIPTLCCESVALAALYAGHSVRFADVSAESLCVTPETVGPLMSIRTRVVLLVHLYGVDVDTASFAPLRKAYPNTVFVEDIAHSLGGYELTGKLLGGALDYTLVSFADSKIIPGDGGMLLLGESAQLLQDEILAAKPVGVLRVPRPRLELSMRNLVHGIADLWREKLGERGQPIFPLVISQYREIIVAPGGIADDQGVRQGFGELQKNRSIRYRNYLRYQAGISSSNATIPYFHEGSTCWRCPIVFQAPAQATAVTVALRSANIPASNHYFPLSVLFDSPPCPNGEDIGLRIVNLWVDENMSDDTIDNSISIINQF